MGMARGSKNLFTVSYAGAVKGRMPKLLIVKPSNVATSALEMIPDSIPLIYSYVMYIKLGIWAMLVSASVSDLSYRLLMLACHPGYVSDG